MQKLYEEQDRLKKRQNDLEKMRIETERIYLFNQRTEAATKIQRFYRDHKKENGYNIKDIK